MPPRDAASSRVSGLLVVATQLRRLGGEQQQKEKLELLVDDVQERVTGPFCPTSRPLQGPFPSTTAQRIGATFSPGCRGRALLLVHCLSESSTIDKSARSPTCKRSRNLSELDAGNGSRGRTGIAPPKNGRQNSWSFPHQASSVFLSPNQGLGSVAESCRSCHGRKLGHPTSRVCRCGLHDSSNGVGRHI